jgi:dihydroorotase
VVHWMCDAPARVWDIVNKGRITVGYDADLVLIDVNRIQVIHNEEQLTKCRWSAWHGVELTGWPVRTWVRGREVFREGKTDDEVRGVEARFDHARGGYWATGGE